MRKDIEIVVDTRNSRISSNSAVAGVKSENLQGNIIIKPIPFIDGVGRFYVSGKGSILMEKQQDYYIMPIRSSILAEGDFDFCFKIIEQENENGVPVFSSEISDMRVLDSIESSETIPEQYPSWIEIFDAKIAEISNLDVDSDGTILTITKKDGTTKEVNVKGEKGDCNFATFEIINGHLIMNKPDNLNQINFILNDNGHLEVEVIV